MIITKKMRRHIDVRGCLVENIVPEIISTSKHFFYTISVPGAVRGNHYHRYKIEWFCIIKGTCRFVTENIKTKKRKEIITCENDGVLFRTEPFIAHAMENIGNDEMIFFGFVNEILDKKNPDTYKYKVI